MYGVTAFLRRFLPSKNGPVRAIDGQQRPTSSDGTDSDAVSLAREFPSSGFERIDFSKKIEEETFAWYSAKKFYPAEIGQLLHGTYQVVTKVGYGTASTTWLCRDLRYGFPSDLCNQGLSLSDG